MILSAWLIIVLIEIYGVVDKILMSSGQNTIQGVEIIEKFVLVICPSIELSPLNIQAHEIDVIIVKNTSDTPYYLIEYYSVNYRYLYLKYFETLLC